MDRALTPVSKHWHGAAVLERLLAKLANGIGGQLRTCKTTAALSPAHLVGRGFEVSNVQGDVVHLGFAQ